MKRPNIDMVRLTPDLIHAGRSAAGGWNKRQLAAIGIDWEDRGGSGWIEQNSDRLVSRAAYREFLALRSVTTRMRGASLTADRPRFVAAVKLVVKWVGADSAIDIAEWIRLNDSTVTREDFDHVLTMSLGEIRAILTEVPSAD